MSYHCLECDVFGSGESCWVCGQSDYLEEIEPQTKTAIEAPPATPNLRWAAGLGYPFSGDE